MSASTKALTEDEKAIWEKNIEELKKKYPDVDFDSKLDFSSGTREERMEQMGKRVEAIAKYHNEADPNAPIPGNTEPWWKTFINYQSDLQENVDETTRGKLEGVVAKMYAAGLTPESIAEAQAEATELMAGHPSILEQMLKLVFNPEGLEKMRKTGEKYAAEGKSSLFPFPFPAKNPEASGQSLETKVDKAPVESLD